MDSAADYLVSVQALNILTQNALIQNPNGVQIPTAVRRAPVPTATRAVPVGGHYRPKTIRPILPKHRTRRRQMQNVNIPSPASLAVPVNAVLAGTNSRPRARVAKVPRENDAGTRAANKTLSSCRLNLAAMECTMLDFIKASAERLKRVREELTSVEVYRGGVKAVVHKKRKVHRKHQRDPRQPKTPVSAYILFCSQERINVRAAMNETASSRDHTVELAKRWAVIDDSLRQRLNVEALRLRHKYDDDMESFNALLRENGEPRVVWVHCKCPECCSLHGLRPRASPQMAILSADGYSQHSAVGIQQSATGVAILQGMIPQQPALLQAIPQSELPIPTGHPATAK